MTHHSHHLTQTSLTFLSLVAAGLLALTGCDKPASEEGQQAEAQKPGGSAQAGGPGKSAGTPADNRPEKTGGTEQPNRRNPGGAAPSAGGPESDKAPNPTEKEQKKAQLKAMQEKAKNDEPITDSELEKFSQVNQQLQSKKAELKGALDEAETPSEAKKAQKKMMVEARKAAAEADLSFERFQAISRRARTDPDLRKRLQKMAPSPEGGSAK